MSDVTSLPVRHLFSISGNVSDPPPAIVPTANGVRVSDGQGGFRLKTGPTFEAGDERYTWLNNVQAIGIGASSMTSLNYDIYELLD